MKTVTAKEASGVSGNFQISRLIRIDASAIIEL
jgi:hypothetical protein